MPGVPLSISYPVLGEPIAIALGKLITAIQTIQTDLEAKVTSPEFSWIGDLSAGGHALTALSQVQLDNIASSLGLPTGTFFFEGGEAWVQTGSGKVQLTSGGTLNASALGGIVGDYGGGNPARVTYTDASGLYTFTDDTGDWSDIEVQGVKMRNTGNWTTLRASNASTTAINWFLAEPPASGVAVVRASSGGVIGCTGALATVSEDLPMSGSVVFSGSGKVKHGSRNQIFCPALPVVANGAETTQFGFSLANAADVKFVRFFLNGFDTTQRVTSFTFTAQAGFPFKVGDVLAIKRYHRDTGAPTVVATHTVVGADSTSVTIAGTYTFLTTDLVAAVVTTAASSSATRLWSQVLAQFDSV